MTDPSTGSMTGAVLAPPRELARVLTVIAALGGVVFFLGAAIAPERVWGGYLMAFQFFVALALAGPLFLAIVYLADARWAFPLRRIPEAMGAALPAAFVLGLVLIIGTHTLYEWSHTQVVEADALLSHKAPWLNVLGFSVRLAVYFALWIWIGRRLTARSFSVQTGAQRRRTNLRTSALFMLLFAVTYSLASVDWVQSLDPHWFSTMYALRTASGLCVTGLAVATIVLAELRRRGPLRDVVTRDVLDDLGKLLLGLSLFWGYIWYCQYMIIWYTNIPEETGYYLLRQEGDWATLWRANLVVNFAVPFLVLMLRRWRRSGVVLERIAAWIVVGHVLDLFVMTAPPIQGAQPRFGVWEIAPLAGALALFALLFVKRLAAVPLVPSET